MEVIGLVGGGFGVVSNSQGSLGSHVSGVGVAAVDGDVEGVKLLQADSSRSHTAIVDEAFGVLVVGGFAVVVVPNKQRVTAEQTSSLGSHVGGFMVVVAKQSSSLGSHVGGFMVVVVGKQSSSLGSHVGSLMPVVGKQISSFGSHVGGFMVVVDGGLGGGTEVVSSGRKVVVSGCDSGVVSVSETGFVSGGGAGVVVGGMKVIVSVCGTVVVSGGGTGVISGLNSNSSHKQSLPHKQSFSPMYDCTKNTPKLSKYTR